MGVKVVPLKDTVAPEAKLLPLMVRLKPGPPWTTEAGLSVLITGGRNWKAPELTVLLKVRGKPAPRSSVVMPAGMKLVLPALIMGLPGSTASVKADPPLFRSGPRFCEYVVVRS